MHKAIKAKTIVLTFDDGPSNRLTPVILKILSKYNVKATFFLLGKNIIGREQIVIQIANEGHHIGSHGYEHFNYWYASPLKSIADIKRGCNSINATLGVQKSSYSFRPPYGKLNIITLVYLWIKRIPIIPWTLVLGDTGVENKLDTQRTFSLIKNCSGGILLAHDFDREDDRLDSKILECISLVLQTAKKMMISNITIAKLLSKE